MQEAIMMREDILDYVDSHPDATPKEVAENVEGANPYTVRTVLDGEGIEPTEPEPMDGEDAGEVDTDEIPREDSEPDVVVISAAKPRDAEATMHQDPECMYLTRFDAKPRDVEREELEGDWSTCGHCWEGEDSEEVEDGEDDVDEDAGDQEAESAVDVKHGSTGAGTVLAEGEDESVDDQEVEPGRDDAHELDQKEWLEVLRACAKQDVGDEVLAKVAALAGGEQ